MQVRGACDGLPLKNSNNSQVWPILENIIGFKDIFNFGAWHGNNCSNPQDPDLFLKSFVDEVKYLQDNNITLRSKAILLLHIRCFIADAPGKSMVLHIFNHGAKFCCTKCTTSAVRVGNTMTYPLLSDTELRKDTSFRARVFP
jgi:hypothetical protein